MKTPERLRGKIASYALDGKADDWWHQLQIYRVDKGKTEVPSWSQMKHLLFNDFLPTTCLIKISNQFSKQEMEEAEKHTNAERLSCTKCLIRSVSGKQEQKELLPYGPKHINPKRENDDSSDNKQKISNKYVECSKEMTDCNGTDVSTAECVISEGPYSGFKAQLAGGVEMGKHLKIDIPSSATCLTKCPSRVSKYMHDGHYHTKEMTATDAIESNVEQIDKVENRMGNQTYDSPQWKVGYTGEEHISTNNQLDAVMSRKCVWGVAVPLDSSTCGVQHSPKVVPKFHATKFKDAMQQEFDSAIPKVDTLCLSKKMTLRYTCLSKHLFARNTDHFATHEVNRAKFLIESTMGLILIQSSNKNHMNLIDGEYMAYTNYIAEFATFLFDPGGVPRLATKGNFGNYFFVSSCILLDCTILLIVVGTELLLFRICGVLDSCMMLRDEIAKRNVLCLCLWPSNALDSLVHFLKGLSLQSSDRINGRILTNYSFCCPIYKGSSWLHGESFMFQMQVVGDVCIMDMIDAQCENGLVGMFVWKTTHSTILSPKLTRRKNSSRRQQSFTLWRLHEEPSNVIVHAFVSFDPGGITNSLKTWNFVNHFCPNTCILFVSINCKWIGEYIEELEYSTKLDFENCFEVAKKNNEKELLKQLSAHMQEGKRMTSSVLRILHFTLRLHITRGRVIPWDGWNDTEAKCIMIHLRIVATASCSRQVITLKLFHKMVNGFDPPMDLDGGKLVSS